MILGNVFRPLTPYEFLIISEDKKNMLSKLYNILLKNVEITDRAKKLGRRLGCLVLRYILEENKNAILTPGRVQHEYELSV